MYQHRAVRDDDFETVARFPRNPAELYFMYPKGSFPLTAGQLKEAAASRFHPTVVVHRDAVVGYANLYDVSAEACWLGNVIVDPAFRGRGAGRYLVATMMSIAKEERQAGRLRLICHNINTDALLFYAKLGFTPFGLRMMKGPDGTDIAGILLEAELQGDRPQRTHGRESG